MNPAQQPFAPQHELDAEIFSTGIWNGETFTQGDLEEIARNFERLKGEIQPPLKFGHDERQTLLGQADGDPALGWVRALRVEGGKLIARLAGLPDVVYRAIQAGRYRRVSSELYFNLRRNGEELGKALKAVALLGADIPAVTNLQDLTALMTAAPRFEAGAVKVFTGPWHARVTPAQPESEPTMVEPSNLTALEAEVSELRAYKVRQEQQQDQDRRQRDGESFRSARKTALAFCEDQVREGRLSPALRNRLAREFDGQAQGFSAAAGLAVSWESVRALVLEGATAALGGEVGFAQTEESPADADPSARLATLATRKMTELGLTYSQAAQYVLKTDPGLARAYRDYTLNLNVGG
jgi:hypothetical protein